MINISSYEANRQTALIDKNIVLLENYEYHIKSINNFIKCSIEQGNYYTKYDFGTNKSITNKIINELKNEGYNCIKSKYLDNVYDIFWK